MKKINYCVIGFLSLQGLLFANAKDGSKTKDQGPSIKELNAESSWQGKIASAGVESGFVIGASFLYQQGRIDGLDYVVTLSNPQTSTPGSLTFDEKMPGLDFKWKPGVRVNIGYIFPQRDQFRLDVTWTHLNAKGKSSVTDSNINLKPLWLSFLLGPNADQASGSWDTKLNLLDGTFGRNFFLGKWLAVNLYGGIRGTWIDQDYKARYHSAWTIDTTGGGNRALTFRDTKFDGENDFTGVGLLLGAEADWYLVHNFMAFTNLKTSLVYGKFDVRQTFNGQVVIPISGIPTIIFPEIIKIKNDFHRLRPSIEGEIGLKWQRFFHDHAYRFFASLSYEFSFWFFQGQFKNMSAQLDSLQNPYITASAANENLQFQGINLHVGFDF